VIFYHPRFVRVFSIWTTHLTTNGSTSRFHLEVFALSYLFQHVL
jgi:hypothetical protein